jgi:hypothetical protein
MCPYTNRRFDPIDQPNILKKGEKASIAKATSRKPTSSSQQATSNYKPNNKQHA